MLCLEATIKKTIAYYQIIFGYGSLPKQRLQHITKLSLVVDVYPNRDYSILSNVCLVVEVDPNRDYIAYYQMYLCYGGLP